MAEMGATSNKKRALARAAATSHPSLLTNTARQAGSAVGRPQAGPTTCSSMAVGQVRFGGSDANTTTMTAEKMATKMVTTARRLYAVPWIPGHSRVLIDCIGAAYRRGVVEFLGVGVEFLGGGVDGVG